MKPIEQPRGICPVCLRLVLTARGRAMAHGMKVRDGKLVPGCPGTGKHAIRDNEMMSKRT